MGGRNRIDFKGGLSKVGTEQEGWGIKTRKYGKRQLELEDILGVMWEPSAETP